MEKKDLQFNEREEFNSVIEPTDVSVQVQGVDTTTGTRRVHQYIRENCR